MEAKCLQSFVQYLVSLALVETLKILSDSSVFRIKWPNDIFGNAQKIGGILCQSDYEDGQYRVTTGNRVIGSRV